MYCKLCKIIINCNEYERLLDKNGVTNSIYAVAVVYFEKQLKLEEKISEAVQIVNEMESKQVMCADCWKHISAWHQFQQKILTTEQEQERLLNFEDIKFEMEVEMCNDNVDFTPSDADNQEFIKIDVDPVKIEKIEDETEVKPSINDNENSSNVTHNDKKVNKRCTRANAANAKKSIRSGIRKLNTRQKSNENKATENKQSTKAKSKTREYDDFIAKHFKSELNCDMCGATFTNYTALRQHFLEKHKTTKSYVICCQRKYHERFHLIEHLRVHLNPQHFQCKECDKCCVSSRTLASHMKNLHPKQPVERQYACNICDKRFAKKAIMQSHMEIHATGEKDFICQHCSKGFVLESRLNLHIKNVHSTTNSVCELCGKSFRGRYALRAHLLEHEGVKKRKWPCDQCEAELHSNYSLKRHKRLAHNDGSTVYVCSICGKVALNQDALRSHKKYVHEMERNFKCNICNKAFKIALVLKEHMTTHTGEVLYKCPHCTKTFKVSANLHHHRKRAHPKEWAENRQQRSLASSVDLSQISNEVVI